MRVLIRETGSEDLRDVPGPADLTGRTGHVFITGDHTKATASWCVAIGAFVMRGGDARWLK